MQESGVSIPRRTVIDFTCDREGNQSPSFVGTVSYPGVLFVEMYSRCILRCSYKKRTNWKELI